ncbi:MAG: peptide chain release factor N(5)-glutamine methyltransferase [Oscillospiraceae bacterium]|nr:peptide chain release factor N(5)-glutamine methyltransferase [Oscillospiraceae bacterium]
MNTYNDLYLRARRKLRAANIEAYELEARLIISHATGKTREELLELSRFFIADNDILNTVDEMLERRLSGEPVAYIVGEWEFYGMPLSVDRSVLIPRVDTEILAAEAIRLMKLKGEKTRVLDLCTGSGAIGLAVAANVPDCRVVAADISESALAICRMNMLRNRLTRNVTAILADAREEPPSLLGTFDAIVCNPPYIPTWELSRLDTSVRDYEPRLALDGGDDGLEFFRLISKKWQTLLREGGYLAFECGIGQSQAVSDIMEVNGFINIKTHLDTLEIERVIVGQVKN